MDCIALVRAHTQPHGVSTPYWTENRHSEKVSSRVVRLGVYVAATPEFTEHPKVADAASELLRDVFGEEAVSSRLVIGVASLPLGSPVELEVILEVKP